MLVPSIVQSAVLCTVVYNVQVVCFWHQVRHFNRTTDYNVHSLKFDDGQWTPTLQCWGSVSSLFHLLFEVIWSTINFHSSHGLTKPFLLEIVLRQIEKWPPENQSPKKTSVPALKSIILTGGFTKPGVGPLVNDPRSKSLSPLTPLEQSPQSREQQDNQLTNISMGPNTEERNLPVKLLLVDRQLGSANANHSVECIYLLASRSVVISPDGEKGDWQVSASELLTELQKTMAAIEGKLFQRHTSVGAPGLFIPTFQQVLPKLVLVILGLFGMVV